MNCSENDLKEMQEIINSLTKQKSEHTTQQTLPHIEK